jgi:RimJ/RimL family protein N-acetyltransferase
MSVLLGPPEPVVAHAAKEHWFDSGDDTRLMGYGKGALGVMLALEDVAEKLQRQSKDFQMLGVYQGGKPVGLFMVESKGKRQKTAELHCYIEPGSRGKWAFHLAGLEILGKLFKSGIYRVECRPLKINKRLIRLLRKRYGFKQEGICRSSWWMDGNDFDTVALSLLRRDWKELKKEN